MSAIACSDAFVFVPGARLSHLPRHTQKTILRYADTHVWAGRLERENGMHQTGCAAFGVRVYRRGWRVWQVSSQVPHVQSLICLSTAASCVSANRLLCHSGEAGCAAHSGCRYNIGQTVWRVYISRGPHCE
eukprot:scaffold67904_cov21-Tisochrysis_lutea.AAC.4